MGMGMAGGGRQAYQQPMPQATAYGGVGFGLSGMGPMGPSTGGAAPGGGGMGMGMGPGMVGGPGMSMMGSPMGGGPMQAMPGMGPMAGLGMGGIGGMAQMHMNPLAMRGMGGMGMGMGMPGMGMPGMGAGMGMGAMGNGLVSFQNHHPRFSPFSMTGLPIPLHLLFLLPRLVMDDPGRLKKNKSNYLPASADAAALLPSPRPHSNGSLLVESPLSSDSFRASSPKTPTVPLPLSVPSEPPLISFLSETDVSNVSLCSSSPSFSLLPLLMITDIVDCPRTPIFPRR